MSSTRYTVYANHELQKKPFCGYAHRTVKVRTQGLESPSIRSSRSGSPDGGRPQVVVAVVIPVVVDEEPTLVPAERDAETVSRLFTTPCPAALQQVPACLHLVC